MREPSPPHGHRAQSADEETLERIAELGEDRPLLGVSEPTWVELARADGALVFANVGWDPSGRWSRDVLDQLQVCHAFLANADEAMAYTRAETPAEALYALFDRLGYGGEDFSAVIELMRGRLDALEKR